MVKFDLNSFYVMRKFRWLGVSITCDVINAGWICTATLTPIGLNKTHPKQVKCFKAKKHKNGSRQFISQKTTKPILKNKKYQLVHPFKCRIAKLAESVFKILAFTFLH